MFHNAFSVTGIMKLRMMVYLPISCDLREGREAVKGIQQKQGWRCLLIGNRYRGDQGRCCGDGSRSAATRRHTSVTCVDSTTEYLEKTGSFIVKRTNKCRVFWCTVNWPRARPESTLIASGAPRSSSFYAGGVRECVVAGAGIPFCFRPFVVN